MKRQKLFKLFTMLIIFTALLSACQTATTPATSLQGDINLQITQVDTNDFPLVHVYISALNRSGEPIAINANKLVLLENGKAVQAESIQGLDAVSNITALFVMDISGSMNFAGKLNAAKAVATQFIDQMHPGDQVGVVTFNTKVGVVQEITSDQELLKQSIADISARDDTAMWDALKTSVEMLNPLPGRKAIILLADGMDNASVSTPEEVLSSIGFGGLSISAIGFGEQPEGEEAPDEYAGIDEATLQMLAQNAGGRYQYAADEAQLAFLFDQIRRALQSEVVISYVTPIALRDGVNRALSVKLADSYQGVGAQTESRFNPGGLVPEVAQPASWTIFGILLAVLVALFVIPYLLVTLKKKPKKKKVRITLKD